MLRTEVETKATMAGVAKEREPDWFMPVVMGFALDKDGFWSRLDGRVERSGRQLELTKEALAFLDEFTREAGTDFSGRLVRLDGGWDRVEWWRFFGREGKKERAVLLSLAWPVERSRDEVWQELACLGEVWQWRKTRMGEAEHEGQVILEATERLADWWLEADRNSQQKEIYEMVIDKNKGGVRVDALAGRLDEEGHYWARDKISGQTIRVFDLARDEQERNDTQRLEMMLRKARERAGVKGEGAEFVYRPTGSLSSVTAGDIPVNIFEVDEDGHVRGKSLTFPSGTSEAEIEREVGKYLTTSRERVEINSRDWGEEFWQGDWQGLPVMDEGLAGTRVGFFRRGNEEGQENRGYLERQEKNETENAGLRGWVMLGVMGVERATGRATEIGTVKVVKASEVISVDSLDMEIKVERKVEERRKKPARLRVAAENGEKEAIRANKITNHRVGFGSKLSVKKPDSLDTDALSYIKSYINNRRPAVRNIVIGAVGAGELEVELESVFRRPAAKLPSRVVSIEPRPGSKPPALAVREDETTTTKSGIVEIGEMREFGEASEFSYGDGVNEGLGRGELAETERAERAERECIGDIGDIRTSPSARTLIAAQLRQTRQIGDIGQGGRAVKKKIVSVSDTEGLVSAEVKDMIDKNRVDSGVDSDKNKESENGKDDQESGIINRTAGVKVIQRESGWSNNNQIERERKVKKMAETEFASNNDGSAGKEGEREKREVKMEKKAEMERKVMEIMEGMERMERKVINLTDGRQSSLLVNEDLGSGERIKEEREEREYIRHIRHIGDVGQIGNIGESGRQAAVLRGLRVKSIVSSQTTVKNRPASVFGLERLGRAEAKIGRLAVWLVLPRIRQPDFKARLLIEREVKVARKVEAGESGGGKEKPRRRRGQKMRLTLAYQSISSNQLAAAASILIILPHVFIYLLEVIAKLS